jgi:hypothetical protein
MQMLKQGADVMRDYPNMSYCAFENTSKAMDQLEDMLGNAIDENEPLDINQYERRYFYRMKEQAQKLAAMMEQYEEHFADYDAEEQGPDQGKLWSDTSAELA